MSYHVYSFEKLEVYQLARKFKIDIKKMSSSFPKIEQFDLISQINRSSSGISSNLAEGSGRATNIDQARFTNMAYATGLETIDHLTTALDMEYITKEKYSEIRIQRDAIMNKLNALYKYQIINKDNLKNHNK